MNFTQIFYIIAVLNISQGLYGMVAKTSQQALNELSEELIGYAQGLGEVSPEWNDLVSRYVTLRHTSDCQKWLSPDYDPKWLALGVLEKNDSWCHNELGGYIMTLLIGQAAEARRMIRTWLMLYKRLKVSLPKDIQLYILTLLDDMAWTFIAGIGCKGLEDSRGMRFSSLYFDLIKEGCVKCSLFLPEKRIIDLIARRAAVSDQVLRKVFLGDTSHIDALRLHIQNVVHGRKEEDGMPSIDQLKKQLKGSIATFDDSAAKKKFLLKLRQPAIVPQDVIEEFVSFTCHLMDLQIMIDLWRPEVVKAVKGSMANL